MTPFIGYNLAVGLIVGIELIYFLYIQEPLNYRRFLLLTITGLLLFVVGGPLSELFFSSLVHWVHGFAALLVIFGLYSPVNDDLRTEEWLQLLVHTPAKVRHSGDWMTPMDDAILNVFHTSELVLTPAIIGFNIDYSREEVNRRLTKLETHGLVEKVERGKYRMTQRGEQYLQGKLPIAPRTGDEN